MSDEAQTAVCEACGDLFEDNGQYVCPECEDTEDYYDDDDYYEENDE